ncbi:winged helix-turn-helix domain-containing protein [Actinoplanes sp. N902-109]|uniref:winged helix-turn-helix domain-containing protein n=1 Tax=Actinoplanes sp. (strain N902-109) TaxID=649831 RepID=UPI0003295593|nr:winged helix-turn-helix domain-containing protein [Actinoplanes sp. N902-109]AGL16995.1 hypothetical protein L083_3485 [Actinoplanes sp. N902-109]
MNDDVRERILALLAAGPATVAILAERLKVPGGVVSYHLKRLEQDGLARIGATRHVRGVPTPAYVSTVAAAPRTLPASAPLPGLTWTGTGRFPIPLWTVDRPSAESADPADPADPARPAGAGDFATSVDPASTVAEAVRFGPGGPESLGTARRSVSVPAPRSAAEDRTAANFHPTPTTGYGIAGTSTADWPAEHSGRTRATAQPQQEAVRSQREAVQSQQGVMQPQQAAAQRARYGPAPLLREVRRVPMDDATFYEFAERLDALAREFAERSVPGARTAEVAIALHRPPSGELAGYGS